MAKCCELIDLPANLQRTNEYVGVTEHGITQKKESPALTELSYYQVFSQKHGFLSNLSIIDLIFNLGPEALIYINNV